MPATGLPRRNAARHEPAGARGEYRNPRSSAYSPASAPALGGSASTSSARDSIQPRRSRPAWTRVQSPERLKTPTSAPSRSVKSSTARPAGSLRTRTSFATTTPCADGEIESFATAESAKTAASAPAAIAGVESRRRSPQLDAEIDQVALPDPLQRGEQVGGGGQHRH